MLKHWQRLNNMINNLRAKAVKKHEIKDGVFELKNNTPKLINKKHNSHVAHILEQNEGENCFVHSQFCDEAFAMICHEFYLNFYEDPPKVDLSYYYFAENGTAIVYLYDMKKTFAGVDVMIHLIEQWKSSICDAKYCVDKADYQLTYPNIHIGVITENNDIERRNNELRPILYPEPDPLPEGLPTFIMSKHQANTAGQIPIAQVLAGFDEGKVTISGVTYHYDVRIFVEKKHHMHFNDGFLK